MEEKRKPVSTIGQIARAVSEYGCAEFLGNVANATMPAGVGPAAKICTKLGARLMGSYAGEKSADWAVSKAERVAKVMKEDGIKGVLEMEDE